MTTGMKIGSYSLPNTFFLAPMAGLTDAPFRQLCKRLGAGYAVSEMLGSQAGLQGTAKSLHRANHVGESAPIAVQIVGTDPLQMAQAAMHNIDCGAHIIDINMGCPARKVCNHWAGSALMQDEALALRIIAAVVAVCAPRAVPVTLKMRTGWSAANRNALSLALAAQAEGVQMIAVHARTREQGFRGDCDYATIAAIKAALQVPVVANGDIDSAEKACAVLAATGADAVMVGRAACERPWIFREAAHLAASGERLAQPLVAEVKHWLLEYLLQHYALYGEFMGVRTARKHIISIVRQLPMGEQFLGAFNLIENGRQQMTALADYFDCLHASADRMPSAHGETGSGKATTTLETAV